MVVNHSRRKQTTPNSFIVNIARWVPHLGIVTTVSVNPRGRQADRVLLELRGTSAFSSGSTLCLPPCIQSSIAFTDSDVETFLPCDGATSWLPPTRHWRIPTSSRKSSTIACVSLGALRRYWHQDQALLLSPPHPPMVIAPNWRLRPRYWRVFWSLQMPPQAFTPWWRLLHDRIGHSAFFNRIMPDTVLSPACRFCGAATEDLFHFVVGCPLKLSFWHGVFLLLDLEHEVNSDLQIWCALTSLSDLDTGSLLSRDVLAVVGAALATLWKYHWRCVFDDEPWSPNAVFSLYQADQALYISSFLSLREVS